ncbi:MAG: response regulator transcription factor [Gemmatimonadaceae bacterium]
MPEHPAGHGESILIVEDDEYLASVLSRILVNAGFRVLTATDGESGLTMALDAQPNLVILDVGLPRRDGVNLTRTLRARGFGAPMLMLTARAAVSDRVSGLDAGADDYLPKPFEYSELLARVKALLRRASMTAASTQLRVRDVVLDPITRKVERGGRPVDLTQKEYALLEYLMRNEGRAVTRQQIAQTVWNTAPEPETNVVDVYINYLRKKLGDSRESPMVHTVRGTGYMIKE